MSYLEKRIDFERMSSSIGLLGRGEVCMVRNEERLTLLGPFFGILVDFGRFSVDFHRFLVDF